MKVAVVQFPGSNCDQDALWALREDVGVQAEYVWHTSHSLDGFDAAFIPGGFTFGDYLRCGAIAARSSVMTEVARFAQEGRPVIGACNGFQILCEAGILPGALLLNSKEKFLCQNVFLKASVTNSLWTQKVDQILDLPIAHGEGRFTCDDDTLKQIEDDGLVAFRYADREGNVTPESNVNGSRDSIAGLVNARGNVLGLMPHPERVTRKILGGSDGLLILNALK